MATSRPIRRGEWLTHIQGHNIGMSHRAVGDENPVEYVRQEDFAIQDITGCAKDACVNGHLCVFFVLNLHRLVVRLL